MIQLYFVSPLCDLKSILSFFGLTNYSTHADLAPTKAVPRSISFNGSLALALASHDRSPQCRNVPKASLLGEVINSYDYSIDYRDDPHNKYPFHWTADVAVRPTGEIKPFELTNRGMAQTLKIPGWVLSLQYDLNKLRQWPFRYCPTDGSKNMKVITRGSIVQPP